MTDKKRKPQKNPCRCPYCDGVTEMALPVCQLCGATIIRCRRCGQALPKGQKTCPSCGGEAEQEPIRRPQSR